MVSGKPIQVQQRPAPPTPAPPPHLMSYALHWHYCLNELPLDGQTVWVRRDAWSDRAALATFNSTGPGFTCTVLTHLGAPLANICLDPARVLCWKHQSLADQDAWEAA